MPEHSTPASRAHPVLFLILFLPLGISNGYVVVTLAYLLSQNGVSVAAIASLAALSLFPQTWKVIWAPLVDTTLTIKLWFLLSALVTGALMIATAAIPPTSGNLVWIEALVVVFSLTSTFNAMAADSLMAHATLPEEKGRAGGWSQAGNLGGSGLGGGAGLWLAQHVSGAWISGAALGLVCILSAGAMFWLREPVAEHRARRYLDSLVNVGRECLDILKSRAGFLALFIMLIPIGVGAAQNLWSAVAGDWHASADAVALVNGALGGVISMAGCIAGGVVCDRMDRKLAYCLFGLALALAAVLMALAPRTQLMFVAFTCLYALVIGFCYAAFGAVVLETIGAGAAATKYNLLAGISNAPIAYQTVIDGWGHDRWGASGLLYVEALCGVAAVALYFIVAAAARRIGPRAWRAAPA
ncbi:MAG TPA: MFS transporter [Rhizomicrobium sp.]|jgi:MFS family permease|nr:MFS transporter [Rhizomicrobium sp.]